MKQIVQKWAKVEPFNLTSSKQVLAYLASKGMKAPLHRKPNKDGVRMPTVDEDALQKLIYKNPQDPILRRVLNARGLQKAMGYLDSTFVWADGRFHPLYLLAETGRILAQKPNIQNQPRGRKPSEKEMALAVRSSIVPSGDEWELAEADYKAVEALLVGWFAGDADYMRASRLGVHAILASHILNRPISLAWSDSDIKEAANEIKKANPFLYDTSKVVVHETGYGATAFAVAKTVECPVADAKRYQAIYDEMAPKVKKWREATRQQAHKEHRLTNPFGFVSPYYFEVFRWDKENGGWELGGQANEVLAFLPQSTLASMLSEVLILIDEQYGDDMGEFAPLAPIHDSVFCEWLKSERDIWAPRLKTLMERPFPELGGLSVEVELKIGETCWAEMKTWP